VINTDNEEAMEGIEDEEKGVKGGQKDSKEKSTFEIEEIQIEEMAIDGICGVY
jgi:mycofactocin precursor